MRFPSLLLLSVLFPIAACVAPDPAAQSDDLTAAGKKLIGEYVDRDGGTFRGLALTSEAVTSGSNRFFADVDTGIVCVTYPCPSSERVEGTFSAGSKYITLKSSTASELVQPLLGKFRYQLVDGELSLTRGDFEQSLEAADSYCSADSAQQDCDVTAADLPHIECVGRWTCSESSSCEWDCSSDKTCGGLAGLTCGPDEYCDYEASRSCGASDQTGTCKARPTSCPLGCPAPEYRLCGCDGESYCNECEANKAGVDISESGEACDADPGPKSCGGLLGLTCGADEYCDYEPTAACGAADQMGTCKARPTSCPLGCPAPQYWKCGCDGQAYCNECAANKAGVDISDAVGTCD